MNPIINDDEFVGRQLRMRGLPEMYAEGEEIDGGDLVEALGDAYENVKYLSILRVWSEHLSGLTDVIDLDEVTNLMESKVSGLWDRPKIRFGLTVLKEFGLIRWSGKKGALDTQYVINKSATR